jgi:hypothetical protein
MMEIASGHKGDEGSAGQTTRFLESVRQRVEGSCRQKEQGKGEIHPAKLLVESYSR